MKMKIFIIYTDCIIDHKTTQRTQLLQNSTSQITERWIYCMAVIKKKHLIKTKTLQ